MEANKDYYSQMMLTIERFQFIEELLKMCILSAIRISEIKLSPYFPFKYKESEITKLPLGQLIRKFIKINNDEGLHQDLKDITSDRNHVAHQSLLFYLSELENEEFMSDKTEKMTDILNRATSIHHRLIDVRRDFAKAENELSRENCKA